MKTFDEIQKDYRISNSERSVSNDGLCAIINLPNWSGNIIVSTGAGWEHVSVTPFKRKIIPSWDDMCRIKDIVFNDDEAVIQIHPPKDEYVNNVPNCLHLWRCSYKEMVLPPSVLVGKRNGQTYYEAEKEILEAYKLAGEKYEKMR